MNLGKVRKTLLNYLDMDLSGLSLKEQEVRKGELLKNISHIRSELAKFYSIPIDTLFLLPDADPCPPELEKLIKQLN